MGEGGNVEVRKERRKEERREKDGINCLTQSPHAWWLGGDAHSELPQPVSTKLVLPLNDIH